MHPLVRDLYKRFLLAGREYPEGLAYVRDKAKTAILRNKELSSELDIKRAVAKGRYWVRELWAVTKLKKYRHLRRAYSGEWDNTTRPGAN